jgi:hypothetical protein
MNRSTSRDAAGKWLPLALAACALLLSACDGPNVQQQFKVVERWSSRWCADETHERLDGCKTSDGLNKLAGAVGVLGGGDGSAPSRVDRGSATRICLDADQEAIWNLNQLLSEGAKLIARDEKMYRYSARSTPIEGQKDYHLITCHYRHVILEGRKSLMKSGRS